MGDRQVPEPNFKQPRLSKRKRTERAWAAKKATRVVLLEELLMRSHGRCELQTPECVGDGSEVHHRLMRSAGGQDVPEHTAWVCQPCHGFAHGHPGMSYDNGWLIRRGAAS